MLGWLVDDLMLLLGIALLALLVMAVLAPIESLGWWAGWRTREPEPDGAPRPEPDAVQPVDAEQYVVYLSGIGKASGRWSYPEEADFIARLKAALPGAVIIDDIFPYAITVRGLEDERGFNVLWRSVNQRLLHRPTASIGWLVNIRNIFQVAVSVDHRYGPFFNLGAAEGILEALRVHGYPLGSGLPIVLIGYSGGAQVSLGAATYLAQELAAPIRVISIGGVMSADPGCRWVQHLHHLYGADDTMDRIGKIAFAGRWPVMKQSPWNQILAEQKVTLMPMGPMAHNGPLGYFSPEPLPDGRPRVEKTVDDVCRIILDDRSAEDSPAAAGRPADEADADGTSVWQGASPQTRSGSEGTAGRSPTAHGGGQA
jgi:hypothetical protein